MAEATERMLPRDLNAEAAVLSAMMIDTGCVSKAIEMLTEEHFYRRQHRLIFRAAAELFEENIEIDIITVIDRLERHGDLDAVGGKLFLNELSNIVISSANLVYHAGIIRSRFLLRSLITTGNDILEMAYAADDAVENVIDRAEQAIFNIAERSDLKTFELIRDIIPETLHNINEAALHQRSVLGVPSGFSDLDRLTGGFRPGQFIVLAARPAMGKTSLALNIAFSAAVYHNFKVGIFTMEMASDELLMRMFSSASEVSMENMLKGYGMDQPKLLRISQVADAMSEKHIYIDDSGTNSALDIRAKSRRLKAEIGGLDLIVLDYLQLMSNRTAKENRQQEIADISRSLKVLAKELEVPVVALSQLNRGLESRPDKRPMLSDLRESGAIEQDADLVMFIYRDEVYNPDSEEKGVAEIIVGKNRHGPTGTVKLVFLKQFTSFRSLGG
ncbi:MAG: replicative DNA helicase [Candidatus Cloacimonetes bacterium]|nr:replicative DNA helicase [Candidatus Cloacimonadota bacterium]